VAARYAVLALLVDRPGHPYELAARFDHRVGKAWGLKRGQVYLTLERLAREGLVEVAESREVGARRRAIYRATEQGRQAFEHWLLTRDAGPVPAVRGDLLVKLAFGAPEHAPHLLELVAEREQQCQDLLAEHIDAATTALGTARAEPSWRDLLPEVLYGAAIVHLEAELQWVARVRTHLESYIATRPIPRELRAELARAPHS
jgi:DNA-binding PadR family transcriptional regulator